MDSEQKAKKIQEVNEKATTYRKELDDNISMMVGMLSLIGLDVHIAPDHNSFVVITDDNKKIIRESIMGKTMSDSFCFRLEFDMLAQARRLGGSDIACGIFMKNVLMALLDSAKSAIMAYDQQKEGAPGSTIA